MASRRDVTRAALGLAFEPAAIDGLLAAQNGDGSWAFGGSTDPGSGDTNMTSFVAMALIAAGRGGDPAIAKALDYLRSAQSADGAWGTGPGDPTDSTSTGFVIAALSAAGESAKAAEWNGAATAMIAFQNGSGAFSYVHDQPTDDILSTLGGLLALTGGFYPVAPMA